MPCGRVAALPAAHQSLHLFAELDGASGGRMTAGTVVITGGILATVILLCIIAVLCYCRLQVSPLSLWPEANHFPIMGAETRGPFRGDKAQSHGMWET